MNGDEFREYTTYTNQYLFPGFEIVSCIGKKFDFISQSFKECSAELLVSIDSIKNTPKGQLIVNCDQNEECLKSFCYHCKEVTYLSSKCETCTFVHENQNPEAYNRYFNKTKTNDDLTLKATDDEDTFDTNRIEFPDDFLLKNKDITFDIVIEQLIEVMENPYSYMICCICKTPMYKTEKCNALSHHKIERCYGCGRIGDKYIGLGDHWNSTGVGGCPRFMYDSYIIYRLKLFICKENECYNHDMGECHVDDHQDGITQYHEERIKSIILHSIQSLLPSIRYLVYDNLFEKFRDTPFLRFLPYKQTLKLLEKHPMRTCDYTEEIMYEQLGIERPEVSIGDDKSKVLEDLQPSKQIYSAYSPYSNYNNTLGISAWRQNFERQRLLVLPELNNLFSEMNNNTVQLRRVVDETDNEIDITDTNNTYATPTIEELTVQLADLGININESEQDHEITRTLSFPYSEIIQTYIDEFGDGSENENHSDDNEIVPLLRNYNECNENQDNDIEDPENITEDLLEIITLD